MIQDCIIGVDAQKDLQMLIDLSNGSVLIPTGDKNVLQISYEEWELPESYRGVINKMNEFDFSDY